MLTNLSYLLAPAAILSSHAFPHVLIEYCHPWGGREILGTNVTFSFNGLTLNSAVDLQIMNN